MTTDTASPSDQPQNASEISGSSSRQTPSVPIDDPTSPAVISLFCGCGGFDLGFEKAGFSVPLAYDADATVVKTYNYNRRKRKNGIVPSIAHVADLLVKTGDEIISDFERLGLNQAPLG